MFAKENIIFLVPYTNPWAWMNRQSIDYTDEIVDVIINKYALPLEPARDAVSGPCQETF